MRVECLGALFSGLIASWLVYGSNTAGAAIGFALVLVSGFNETLLYWVRLYNRLEVESNRFVSYILTHIFVNTIVPSLERIRDFLNIEHEPEPTKDGTPPAYWPASGALHVERLSARYSVDGPRVLEDISFTINPSERVGVGPSFFS